MDLRLWSVFGGIGLFLTGMYLMEGAVGQLAGRRFKLLLRRHTSNNFRATLSGVLITAVLQSSSLVSFIVLAFAGNGILRLQNALAVILGANIGTTLSNWFIATLGFSFRIDLLWFPVMGLAGTVLFIFQQRKGITAFCHFFLGMSFLFIALDFMKNGMMGVVESFDLSQIADAPMFLFVTAGFGITFLIQSSTATMALTLSALHSGAIPFDSAVAIIIGSELGTSLKLMLASLSGSADKKRLAAGNIILNLATTIIAFLFMNSLIRLVTEFLGINDPLQALVLFQLVINTAATLLFLPFLEKLSDWLRKRYLEGEHRASLYIDHRIPAIPSLALEIFRFEVEYFVKRVLAYAAVEFSIREAYHELEKLFTEKEWLREESMNHLKDRYQEIRTAQGELIEYYAGLQKTGMSQEDLNESARLVQSVQEAMHAAKGFKDIAHNKNELLQSGNDLKFDQFNFFSELVNRNLKRLSEFYRDDKKAHDPTILKRQLEDIRLDYILALEHIYRLAGRDSLPERDISTLQNLNRELYSAHRAITLSIAHLSSNGRTPEDINEVATERS
jgi:phosphate:Na+ symporter